MYTTLNIIRNAIGVAALLLFINAASALVGIGGFAKRQPQFSVPFKSHSHHDSNDMTIRKANTILHQAFSSSIDDALSNSTYSSLSYSASIKSKVPKKTDHSVRIQWMNEEEEDKLSYSYGMPWRTSIAPYTFHNKEDSSSNTKSPTMKDETLLFMPYFEYMTSLLQTEGCLTNVKRLNDNYDSNNQQLQHIQSSASSSEIYAYNEKISSSSSTTTTTTSSTSKSTPPSNKNNSRVINQSYTSDEYRKIRMTYYDAGDQIQVFNSLWYPNPTTNKWNVPLLGIDLLAFGRKRYLVVIDFQPLPGYHDLCSNIISNDDDILLTKNEEELVERLWNEGMDQGEESIRRIFGCDVMSNQKEDSDDWNVSGTSSSMTDESNSRSNQELKLPQQLKGKMSSRFYDEAQFFSKSMLFGRFDFDKEHMIYPSSLNNYDDDMIHEEDGDDEEGVLFSAFKQSLKAHIQLTKSASSSSDGAQCRGSSTNPEDEINYKKVQNFMEMLVWEGQRQYDVYSAKRDPAHALFTKQFGKEWADGYVYDFLFDLSGGSQNIH